MGFITTIFRLALLTAPLLAALSPATASALRVTPFVVSFEPSGQGAQRAFRVENGTNQTIAVQVSAFARDMDEEGKDILTPADNKFAIFPDQLTLKPGEARTVRVQWNGNPAPQSELAYRLIFEQLPVTFSEGKEVGVTFSMLLRYATAVYIAPRGVAPDLFVESVASKDGAVRLGIRNRGTRHFNLEGFRIVLTLSNGREITLTEAEWPDLAGENVLPGRLRFFTLPKTQDMGNLSVQSARLLIEP